MSFHSFDQMYQNALDEENGNLIASSGNHPTQGSRSVSSGSKCLDLIPNSIPMLNFDPRRAVLEQSIMVTNEHNRPAVCFSKFLFQNHRSINTAHRDSVYFFCMVIENGITRFCFSGNNTCLTRTFTLTLDQAADLMFILKPNQTFVRIELEGFQTSNYLNLLPITKGKLSMVISRYFELAPVLIKAHWDRFEKLTCWGTSLIRMPSKRFKKLCVYVELFSDMLLALKHNCDKLKLLVQKGFVDSGEVIQNVGKVCECHLQCHRLSTLGAIKAVMRSHLAPKKLQIDTIFITHRAHLYPIMALFRRFTSLYSVYNNAVRLLLQGDVETTMRLYADISGYGFTLPVNWVSDLLEDDAFSLIKAKTVVEGDLVTTCFKASQEVKNVNAAFFFRVRYFYAPPIQVVQGEGDIQIAFNP